jgi:hypothetical protein
MSRFSGSPAQHKQLLKTLYCGAISLCLKFIKIEHTVEGIFDVVSSIILNTDHSLRVLKIFFFSLQ